MIETISMSLFGKRERGRCDTGQSATPAGGRTVPDFGKMYHVKGVLSLPYSKVEPEPFEAWYDLEGNRSRINYRNGTVQTFLIGNYFDYGAIYKITPVSNETEIQAIKCFQLNGTKKDPIRPQAALPDLQGFEIYISPN
ncbi:counting factor associated D-like protein [Labeo rohita]|uniref:Counting factor associated D-like protein n=1 Tax=Labeo rohita TaxID=84645 RepID=A0A498NV46_LABRO|nr:counting factor associated D-like protein [Labeo rohita]